MKNSLQVTIVICITLLLISSSISAVTFVHAESANDWLMFHHGPAHEGYTTSEPVKPVKLWSYTQGHSSDTYFGFQSSPAVANGIVYYGYHWDGTVYAFNAFSGAKIWNYTTSGGVFSSPAVSDNIVYIGSNDNNIYALKASTGSKIWNYSTDGEVHSSPTVVNSVVYIGSTDGNVYALNASTGKKIWNYTTSGAVESSPAVVKGVVYVGSFFGNDVYALNAFTGSKIWNYSTGDDWSAFGSSPAVNDGMVYIGSVDGRVYALDALSGFQIWNFSTPNGLGYAGGHYLGIMSSPAVAEGVVYVGAQDGYFYALNASTGAEVWKVDGGGFSSPAVADGVVYVGNYFHGGDGSDPLMALNATNGALIWDFPTDKYVPSSPAIVNGVVYFANGNGNLFAIGEPSQTPTSASPSPSIPEFQPWILLPLVITGMLLTVLFIKRNKKQNDRSTIPY